MRLSIKLHLLLFCYIFSFYITAFPASMVIAAPLFICICANNNYLKCFMKVWGNKYIFRCFCFLLFLVGFSTLYPLIFRTLDFSLVTILITQVIHFICATFFFAFLDFHNITFDKLCNAFINIFIIQTIIQCIACASPNTIGLIVRKFNRFDTESVIGLGDRVRGWALSAATTYHLSLIYGVAFIIYIKSLINSKKITFVQIVKGVFIFIGIFFAGRTGFVGVGIAGLYFIITLKASFKKKIKTFIKALILVTIIISSFLTFAPQRIRGIVVDNLIPYAFEFVYSKFESGKAQTASTNQLMDMWNRDFDDMELIRGSGRYMDFTGKRYYMHVDPGVLRHLLYGGILFYLILILYQILLTFPFIKQKDYYIFMLCFIYYFIMDFKGVTIALNKFAFVTSLLFGYSYIKTYTKRNKKYENIIRYSISTK